MWRYQSHLLMWLNLFCAGVHYWDNNQTFISSMRTVTTTKNLNKYTSHRVASRLFQPTIDGDTIDVESL